MIESARAPYKSVDMKNIGLSLLLVFAYSCGQAQAPTSKLVLNPKFDQTIRSYLDFSVPIITVDEFATRRDQYVVLDAREPHEFAVSHIEGAQYIGFKDWDQSVLDRLDPEQEIVIYCSIGYRSEKIGEKLQKRGFSKVRNLYGSIFEWVNQGHPVVNDAGKTTNLHTYDRKWGKWVDNPAITKQTKK